MMAWLAAIVLAQQTLVQIEKITIPDLGPYAVIRPVEIDHNPRTREWVSWDWDGPFVHWFRVITLRDGKLCMGPRYWPWPTRTDYGVFGDVRWTGDTHVLTIESPTYYEEQGFNLPSACVVQSVP